MGKMVQVEIHASTGHKLFTRYLCLNTNSLMIRLELHPRFWNLNPANRPQVVSWSKLPNPIEKCIGRPRPRASRVVALVVMVKEHQVAPIVFSQVNITRKLQTLIRNCDFPSSSILLLVPMIGGGYLVPRSLQLW
jgi:hypothetical protein